MRLPALTDLTPRQQEISDKIAAKRGATRGPFLIWLRSPELAEKVESADAKTWTVKLRSGVTFHDGKSLTSADVVFSLKRHLDPAVGSKVNAIAKEITASFPTGSNLVKSALIFLGLVLFATTLLVNILARLIVNRSQAGS